MHKVMKNYFVDTLYSLALYLRGFLPKKLFVRSALILLIMIIIIQAIITKVFLDSHWNKVTKVASESIAREISLVHNTYKLYGKEKAINVAKHLGIRVQFLSKLVSPDMLQNKYISSTANKWEERRLKLVLSDMLDFDYRVSIDSKDIRIITAVDDDSIYLKFLINKKRLINPTTDVFIAWTVLAPLVLFLIAAIFLRNQLRPIQKLARAATKFGKGDLNYTFKPQGATEIRSAGKAFLVMRNRIIKQLNQRTEMLAAVSHDLRTPLTRMELQLSMMGGDDKISKQVKNLLRDVRQMENIINDYLSFVRGEGAEKTKRVNALELFNKIAGTFNIAPIKRHKREDDVYIYVRKSSIERCFSNIFSNSLRYGGEIKTDFVVDGDSVKFIIEDNGPGIPESERKNIFKPFYRLDNSRNRDTGGVGLGLSIVQDILTGHGGSIEATDSISFSTGARFIITLPRE